MKTINKLAAVALLVMTSTAYAGTGGSEANIQAAVNSGSVDSIIAEVERAEGLMCEECIATVMNLTEDNRFAVREVAAWWIAKRPGLTEATAQGMLGDLQSGDSIKVRNAADFLGAVRYYGALPSLQTTLLAGNLSTEAKLSIVRAVGYMAHVKGNVTLQTAMGDSAPEVRALAIKVWRDVLDQKDAGTVPNYLTDPDARVRAEAAGVVGWARTPSAVGALVKIVTTDPDSSARRNAAWALGQIGSVAAAPALTAAMIGQVGPRTRCREGIDHEAALICLTPDDLGRPSKGRPLSFLR